MKEIIAAAILIVSLASGSVSAQSIITGIVIEKSSGEPVLFGTVALFKDGVLLTGTETDLDGKYQLDNISTGSYIVKFYSVGLKDKKKEVIIRDSDSIINIALEEEPEILSICYDYPPTAPTIEFDAFTQGRTLTLTDSGTINHCSSFVRD